MWTLSASAPILRVRTADGDVHLVLILARAADVRRLVGVGDFLVGRLHPLDGSFVAGSTGSSIFVDLERLILFRVEHHRLRVGVALQEVEADEAGRERLDVRLHDRVDRELRGRRGGIVRLERDGLGDRAGEGGRIDVRRDLAGLAGLDDLVEVGDRAAAAGLGGDDLQVGVAGVLDEERPVELLALGDRAVILDRLDDREAGRLLCFLRGFGLLLVGSRRLLRLAPADRRQRKGWRSTRPGPQS